MKKTIKCYLSYCTSRYTPGFGVSDMDLSSLGDHIFVSTLNVEFEVPDDFDPRPAQIKAIEEKQRLAAAAFHAMTVENTRLINELKALEMT